MLGAYQLVVNGGIDQMKWKGALYLASTVVGVFRSYVFKLAGQ
jgi:hypothetical protein